MDYDEAEESLRKCKEELRKETMRTLEALKCKRCGGIIVRSWAIAMLANVYGYRCECKNPILPEALQE